MVANTSRAVATLGRPDAGPTLVGGARRIRAPDLGAVGGEELERLLAVAGRDDLVAEPLEEAAADLAGHPETGVVLLFGGTSNGTPLDDTRTWDGEVWTQRRARNLRPVPGRCGACP